MGCSASYLSSWARKIGLNHWSLSFILLSAIFSPLTSWAHCLLHSLNSSGTDCSLASSTTKPLPHSAPEAKAAKLPWESDAHSASSSLPCPSSCDQRRPSRSHYCTFLQVWHTVKLVQTFFVLLIDVKKLLPSLLSHFYGRLSATIWPLSSFLSHASLWKDEFNVMWTCGKVLRAVISCRDSFLYRGALHSSLNYVRCPLQVEFLYFWVGDLIHYG
jgi:hypothetical protein